MSYFFKKQEKTIDNYRKIVYTVTTRKAQNTYIMEGKYNMAKSTFLKDFKAFITKGNVIDMAVGVVIGGSFGKIVTGLVNYIINPFVGIFLKSGSLDSIKTVITEASPEVLDEAGNVVTPAVAEVAILWGTWMQTILDFLITALCIFVVLRIITGIKKRAERKEIEAAEAKAAAEKAAAEEAKAAADKAAADAAAHQARLDASILKQEELLAEIAKAMKNK